MSAWLDRIAPTMPPEPSRLDLLDGVGRMGEDEMLARVREALEAMDPAPVERIAAAVRDGLRMGA